MELVLAMAQPEAWKIALVLGLLVVAIILFSLEVFSIDVITLLLLMTLIGSGVLTAGEAFAGFSSEIIIILASIFIITGSLQETGILDAIGAKLIELASGSANRLFLMLLGLVSGLSAFMNNTTVTAMFVGPVIGAAHRTKQPPSKMLMPVAFASMLGGTCTLIGTSTNVAVSGFIVMQKMEPVGLFEITPVGLAIVAVGITYLTLVGRRLLPAYKDENLVEDFALRKYSSEIAVLPKSPLIGQKIFKSDLAKLGFRVLKVIRDKEKFVPNARSVIHENDVLLVSGNVENLMKVKSTEGIEIRADLQLRQADLESEDVKVAEALVTPQSNLVNRTLAEANYQQESGVTVLAISRRGRTLRSAIGATTLKVGDLLLVQGLPERLEALKRRRELAMMGELSGAFLRKRKGLYVAGSFVLALTLGGLKVAPLSICFLGAAVATVLLRCITAERAYQFIDWRLLVLVGGMSAFGTAMAKTGGAEWLAGWIIQWLEPLGVMPILAGFFVLTILLTQPMSNAAAALVILPVALEAARALEVNERTFAIAIMLAASVSFIAPFEPSCILVYGPGKYKFRDFVKNGFLLTAILTALVLVLIPMRWPLQPKPGHSAENLRAGSTNMLMQSGHSSTNTGETGASP